MNLANVSRITSPAADERAPRVYVPRANDASRSPQEELEQLRRERDALREQLDRIAQIIRARPDKLEHDLRNVMNELVLLRKLAETDLD